MRDTTMNEIQSVALRAGIAASIALLFATGCRPATVSETVDTYTVSSESLTRPTTAVELSGARVYVAWVAKDDSIANVYLARLDRPGGSTFSHPVRVNDIPGDAAGHQQAPAQVAVAPDGTVYVAWLTQTDVPGRRFPASDIRLARSTDGGQTFEPAITVNEDSGFPTGHHFHNLAVGPDGTVYVSWLDTRERDRAQAAGSGAATMIHASAQMGHGAHHAGTSGPAGPGKHTPEPKDDLPGTQVRVARSTDGGRSFGPSVVVAEGTCQCCRTALAISEDGTVYVAWRHIFGGITRDMALARSEDGGQTFSKPVRIHADGWMIDGCPHSGPSLTVDRDRNVHVAWYTGAPERAGLYYTVSRDGGASFEPAQALAKDVAVAQTSLATDEQGYTWIAWENPGEDCVCLTRADARGTLHLAAADTLSGSGPALATASSTHAMAWRSGKAIQVRVMQGNM